MRKNGRRGYTLKQKKKWWVLLTIIWIIMIYFMTEMSYFTGESTGTAIRKTIDSTENLQQKVVKPTEKQSTVLQPADPRTIHHLNVFFRKSAHIIVFGILAIFIYRCFEHRRYSYLSALLLTFFYASFDEWHQSQVPERTPAFKDVLFDTFGACVALLFIFILTREKRIHKVTR